MIGKFEFATDYMIQFYSVLLIVNIFFTITITMNVNVKKTPTLWSTVKQAADHQNGPSTSTTVSSATVEGKDKVGGTDSSSGSSDGKGQHHEHSIKIFTDKGGTPQLGTVSQAVLGAF